MNGRLRGVLFVMAFCFFVSPSKCLGGEVEVRKANPLSGSVLLSTSAASYGVVISSMSGQTVGDYYVNGLTLIFPVDVLPVPQEILVMYTSVFASLPSPYVELRNKLPPGTLRFFIEISPSRPGDTLPDRLDKTFNIALKRDGDASTGLAVYHWEPNAGVWTKASQHELNPPFNNTVTVTDDRTGLYAVVEVTTTLEPTQVLFYPQPRVGRQATLRLLGSAGGSVRLSLYNTLGQRVLERSLEVSSVILNGAWAGEVSVDLSDLSSGLYFCVVAPAEGGWRSTCRLAVVR
jgi:hypothetical protein